MQLHDQRQILSTVELVHGNLSTLPFASNESFISLMRPDGTAHRLVRTKHGMSQPPHTLGYLIGLGLIVPNFVHGARLIESILLKTAIKFVQTCMECPFKYPEGAKHPQQTSPLTFFQWRSAVFNGTP